jgi:hypothetical protein
VQVQFPAIWFKQGANISWARSRKTYARGFINAICLAR